MRSASRSPSSTARSFGGFVAQSYATRHPDHPAKLILTSTAARVDFPTIFAAFERIGGRHARDVAEAYWLDPTVERRAKYLEVCFPLYRARPGRERRRTKARHRQARRGASGSTDRATSRGAWTFRSGSRSAFDARCWSWPATRDPIMPMAFSETIAGCLPSRIWCAWSGSAGCGHGVHLGRSGAGVSRAT